MREQTVLAALATASLWLVFAGGAQSSFSIMAGGADLLAGIVYGFAAGTIQSAGAVVAVLAETLGDDGGTNYQEHHEAGQ